MKATEANLLGFLKKSPQFIIPIYQRTYSWTEKECRQLWEDILRAGKDETIPVHFIGSIVYIESGLSQVSHQAPLLVIDGQQRLSTVTILLAAVAKALGDTEPVDGFSARKIRNYYLVNPEETGERHFKLLLSQTDKPIDNFASHHPPHHGAASPAVRRRHQRHRLALEQNTKYSGGRRCSPISRQHATLVGRADTIHIMTQTSGR
ncbi:DUF262 domain-containing protein [Pararhizobium sp. LjRoot238]|uniref:DUF262 domain-containing protein n=1 Tax=Pararhizobium sp. LjRoot238 TaxID=3342293 RepID=UPI003F50BA14